MLTARTGETLVVEADHRAHGQGELVLRDLKDGPLGHCPSGKFAANASWVPVAALAHNLGRWTLAAAAPDFDSATVGSLRRKLIAMPARLVASGRRRWLRVPTNWP